MWEGFELGAEDAGGLRGGANLKRDVLARLAEDDAAAGFASAIDALGRPAPAPAARLRALDASARPVAAPARRPHATRMRPHALRRPGEPGLGRARSGRSTRQFGRHVLQAQYADRLVGGLLDALREHGLYDKAVIVVAADHGAAFRTGQPRRPANHANAADIADVPLFVKLPGQREGRVDDRSVRTIDVLPTIAKAAGARVPWRTDGMPADERTVDTAARIDVSHAGVDAIDEPLSRLLALRAEREAVEGRLLRDGPYAIGPAPSLIGRRVAGARRAEGGPRATVDGAAELADVDPAGAVVPALVSGSVTGLGRDAVVAIAVNGRVAATTRTFADGDRLAYAAMVPPSALRAGRNAVTVLQVAAGGALRPLGGT